MTVIISTTVRCPYPNCCYTADVITNNHCTTAHNMQRKELFGRYGKPQRIGYDPQAVNKNLEGHVTVNAKDRELLERFEGGEQG